MSKPKPKARSSAAFNVAEEHHMSHGLNKVTRTWGGHSGYNSECREVKPYDTFGKILSTYTDKTVIYLPKRRITKLGYYPPEEVFLIPYASKAEYYLEDAYEPSMVVVKN